MTCKMSGHAFEISLIAAKMKNLIDDPKACLSYDEHSRLRRIINQIQHFANKASRATSHTYEEILRENNYVETNEYADKTGIV